MECFTHIWNRTRVMMRSFKYRDWHDITKHSLLHHSIDMSDFCKYYAIHRKISNDRIDEIVQEILSLWLGWTNSNNKKGKGFIHIKPFLHTKKETIYGSNTKHLEWRISILQDKKHSYIFYFILLINYNSTLDKFLFWPVSVLLRLSFIIRIKKLLSHTILPISNWDPDKSKTDAIKPSRDQHVDTF